MVANFGLFTLRKNEPRLAINHRENNCTRSAGFPSRRINTVQKISILRPPSASDRTPRRAVEPLSQLWRFSDQASRRVVSDKHPHLRLHHAVRSDGCARHYRPSGILHGPRLSGGIVLPGVWPRDRSSRTRPDPVPAWPVRVEAEQPQYQQVCPECIDIG